MQTTPAERLKLKQNKSLHGDSDACDSRIHPGMPEALWVIVCSTSSDGGMSANISSKSINGT